MLWQQLDLGLSPGVATLWLCDLVQISSLFRSPFLLLQDRDRVMRPNESVGSASDIS